MKKALFPRLAALLLALLMVSSVSFAQETIQTVDCSGSGLIFQIPQSLLDMGLSVYVDNSAAGYPRCTLSYYCISALNELQSNVEEALNAEDEAAYTALMEEAYRHIHDLAGYTLLHKEDYDAAVAEGKQPADLVAEVEGLDKSTVQTAGENDGYVYLSYRMAQLDADALSQLSEEEVSQYQQCLTALDDILAGAELTAVSDGGAVLPETFPAFTTQDLNGGTVTSDLFAQKDLTVVNIWGTFCGPCIGEMPELAEWNKTLPENVQLVGLLCDVYSLEDKEQVQAAQDIVKDSGVEYVNLICNDELMALLNNVSAVPTTLFVDSTGAIVGDGIVGANVEAYKAFVEDYLNAQ